MSSIGQGSGYLFCNFDSVLFKLSSVLLVQCDAMVPHLITSLIDLFIPASAYVSS
jgi:hypothetical protein